MREDIIGSGRVRHVDLDFSESWIRRAGYRCSPRKGSAALRVGTAALAHRGRRLLELRRGEPVLRHPKGERARLQRGGAVGALSDAAKTSGQRHGQDRQRDQDLDQRKTVAAF